MYITVAVTKAWRIAIRLLKITIVRLYLEEATPTLRRSYPAMMILILIMIMMMRVQLSRMKIVDR
jgi:hypothetical protein